MANGDYIDIDTAAALTKKYRDEAGEGATIGHAIDASFIEGVLDGAVGMRVYYGIDDDGNKQLVFVGIDNDGNDLIEGKIADNCSPCPTYCSTSNPLNTDQA